MLFSIGLLILVVFFAFKAAPVEKRNHVLLHGAGMDQSQTETFLDQYLVRQPKRKPKLGGAPKETALGDKEDRKD